MKQLKNWLAASVILGVASTAAAEVRLDGDWPEGSRKVSIHVHDAHKSEAASELAKAAGWNLVVHGDPAGTVTLDVTDAEPKDVLEAIFADGSFVATRKGSVLEINAAAPAVPVAKKDRAVIGHNLRVEAAETVGDVSLTGGSAEIFGTVEGDLVVTGGSVTVHDGGHVTGDAMAIGGAIHVERGGKVDGDHKVIGGAYWSDEESGDKKPDDAPKTLWTRAKRASSEAFGNFAFLFIVGALFLAAAPDRMQRLRTEIAKQPVASVAYGLGGLFGSFLAFVVLCITVIGIPFALVGLLLAVVATTGSLCAALTTAGAAALGHRTQNHYVHLALGAAAFAACGLLPWLGGWLQFGALLAGIGILVTTRVAGFVNRRGPQDPPSSSGLPYR